MNLRSILWAAGGLAVAAAVALFLQSSAGCGTAAADVQVRLLVFDIASGEPVADAIVAIVADEGSVADSSWLTTVDPDPDKALMEGVSHGLYARGTTSAQGICALRYADYRSTCQSVLDDLLGHQPQVGPWGQVGGVCFVMREGFQSEVISLASFARVDRADPSVTAITLDRSVGLKRER